MRIGMDSLLFRGSRERLKKFVLKHEGELLENQGFRLLWRSPYFRRGLTFRVLGTYRKTEEGYRLDYRFVPSPAAVIWVMLPVGFLLAFAVWECAMGNYESAASVSAFSLMYPAVAFWQYVSCRRGFRRVFSVATK